MAIKYKLASDEKEKAKQIISELDDAYNPKSLNNIARHNAKEGFLGGIEITPSGEVKRLTANDIKARKEAEELNKTIEKGGPEATSAVIGHTVKSFSGGFLKGSAGIANAVMLPVAGILQMAGNKEGANDILDEADRISSIGNYTSNVNAGINNEGIKTVGKVMDSVGNMMPSIISNLAVPGLRISSNWS